MDAANARDDPGTGRGAVVHAMRRRGADFQKGRAGVKQVRDPFARQHLPPRQVTVAGALSTTGSRGLRRFADFGQRGQMRVDVRFEGIRRWQSLGLQFHCS